MVGPALEVQLLNLVAGPEADFPLTDDMSPDIWCALDSRADEHRLRPLLHTQWSGQAAIPATIRQRWADAYRSAALTALRQRAELIALVERLERAGIAALALKGSWLAWHVYANPAERPLRDLDLLVPADRVLEAHSLLIDAGCVQDDVGVMPLDEWARRFKHLPPLETPAGTVVELHLRLWDDDGRNQPQPVGLFERAVTDPDQPGLHYPCAPDMLMHLAVHAALHRFDGGPLMLIDFERIVATRTFDWPAIWTRAAAERWDRALALCLLAADRWLAPGMAARTACPVTVPVELIETMPALIAKPLAARDADATLAKLSRPDIGGAEKLRRVIRRRERFERGGDYLAWIGREAGAAVQARFQRPDQARRFAQLDGWLNG